MVLEVQSADQWWQYVVIYQKCRFLALLQTHRMEVQAVGPRHACLTHLENRRPAFEPSPLISQRGSLSTPWSYQAITFNF